MEIRKAIKKLQEELQFGKNWDWKEDYNNDYLTANVGKSGRHYLWYYDGCREACIDIDNLYLLTDEEIMEEFNIIAQEGM